MLIVNCAVCALIFIIDIFNPLEYAVWLLYTIPLIWVAYKYLDRKLLFTTAVLESIFIFTAFFLKTDISHLKDDFSNRSIFTILLWVIAYIQIERGKTYLTLQQNIDDIMYAEAALHEARVRYDTLFNNKTIGIAHCRIVTDEHENPIDYEILQINDTYSQITGIKKEDIEGKTAREVFPGIENFSFDYIGSYGEIAIEGGELNFESYFEATSQWLSIYVYQPVYGEFTAIFTDISDRKKSEENLQRALKESNDTKRQLEAVFQSMADGIAIFNMNGEVIHINEAQAQINGFDNIDDMLRNLKFYAEIYELRYWDGQVVPVDQWPVSRVLRGEHVDDLKLHGKRTDTGQEWDFSFSGRPIYDEQGLQFLAMIITRDVTESKKAEEALRESEHILKLILENVNEGIILSDAINNKILAISRWDLNNISGSLPNTIVDLPLEQFQKIRDVRDLKTGERVKPEDIPVARALRGEFLYNEEYILGRPDGSSFIASVNAFPIYNENKTKIINAIAIWTDITERKQAEEALQASEAAMEAFFNASPGILNLFDEKLRYIKTDPVSPTYFGFNRQSIIGKSIKEINPPYIQKVLEPIIRQVTESGKTIPDIEVQGPVSSRKGEIGYYSVSYFPVPLSKGKIGLGVIGIDITDMKHAENDLRESEERFSKIYQNHPDPIIISKIEDGTILEVNDAFLMHFGWEREEVIGKTALTLNLYGDTNDRNKVINLLNTKGRIYKQELNVKLKNGELRTALLSVDLLPLYKREVMLTTFQDITELKQTERALKESEERFRTLADNMSQLAWMADNKGFLFWYNKRWYDYTGTTFEEMEGWGWKKVHNPEHVERVADKFLKHVESGEPWEDTFPLRSKDGEYRWFLSRALPIKDSDGNIIRWFGTNTDITDQKKLEEQLYYTLGNLKESTERFSTAFMNHPDALSISRVEDGVFLEVNDAFLSLYGYEREEIIGHSAITLGIYADNDEREKLMDIIDQEGKVHRYELDVRLKNGDKRTILLSVDQLTSYDENILLSTNQDITELKKAEDALKESEERFSAAFKDHPDPLAITKYEDGTYVEVNDSFLSIFGHKREEVIGKTPASINFYADLEDRKKIISIIDKEGKVIKYELNVKRKNGELKTILLTVDLLPSIKEKTLLAIMQDITELKKAELALKASEEKFSGAFMNNPEPVLITRAETGAFIEINDAFLSLFGYEREEVMKTTILDLNFYADIEDRKKIISILNQKGYVHRYELQWRTKSGELKIVLLSVNLLNVNNEKFMLGTIHDITELRKAESLLKEANEEIKNILETISDNFLALDRNYRFKYVNKEVLSRLNLKYEEVIGKTIWDIYPGMRGTLFETNYRKAFEEQKPVRFIDQSPVDKQWFDISVYPSEDGITVYGKNITQRIKAQEALKESEEKFSTVFNLTTDALVISKVEDGTIIDVNSAFLELFGWEKDEVIGKTSQSLDMFADKSDRNKTIEQLKENGKIDKMEIKIKRRSGEERYVLLSVKMFPLLGKQTMLTTIEDITEIKQIEIALRESEEKLLDAQKIARFGNYTVDMLNNNKITWSEEMYDLWEVDRNNPPLFEELWNKIHPDDREYVRSAILQETKNREVVETEFRLILPGNRIKHILLITRGILDENGNLIKRQGVEMDITDRKDAALKLYNTMQELERSNKELEQFAYVASHDLQEPMRMVSSFTKLMERQLKDKIDEKSKDYMHFIFDGVKRMQTLIQDLLTYSRVTTKAEPFVSCDLNSIIDDVLTDLQVAIKETNAEIKIENLPEVNVDPTQMKQLFQNLLSNAIKFHNTRKPVIKIDVKRKNKEWIISVKDNGIGIDQQNHDKIFEIFQRLHERDKYPGTGIGLAICKKIVERHSGKIWVQSEEGKGTTFYFTLPA